MKNEKQGSLTRSEAIRLKVSVAEIAIQEERQRIVGVLGKLSDVDVSCDTGCCSAKGACGQVIKEAISLITKQ